MPFGRYGVRFVATSLLAPALVLALSSSVLALSEIQREELPPAEETTGEDAPAAAPGLPVPMPEPVTPPSATQPAVTPGDAIPEDETVTPPTGEEPADPSTADEPERNGPVPDILYDKALLPEPVRRMHGLLVEACLSGDIERLRALITPGADGTQLSLGGIEGDPIQFMKELSGDGEGHEILAILVEVLNAGFVHLDPGEPGELYVWPYFFAVPLDRLTAPQRVELFKIVTAGDYEEMKSYGAYIFYRAGITPDGEWAFFVAGD